MRIWIVLPLALCLAGCAQSSRMTFLTAPSVDVRDTVNVKAYEEKYGTYDGVFLFVDNTIEHAGNESRLSDFFTSWNYYYVLHEKYILLNPDNVLLSTFTLNTANIENVGNLFLQATYPDGQVTRWSQKDLVLTKDPDGYVRYKFIYPRVVKGTIIEEGYELNYRIGMQRPPLAHDISLQYTIPCERLRFRYAHPNWWNIKVKKLADSLPPAYTIVQDSAHNKCILKAELNNLSAVVSEPYAPYFKEVGQYLKFMISKLQMGTFYFERPSTWKDYVKEYQSYLLDRDGFLSMKVSDTTKYLVDDISDPLKKLSSIISYLQNTVTPVQDREDRDFADVLKQKKGNAYVITGLAYSMLKKAGLEPSYLLIHSAMEGTFDSAYVSFDQLSIPAIRVEIAGKQYVVFPYRKDLSLGQVQQDYTDQPALVLGTEGTYSITKVSAGTSIENKEIENYEITVSEEGTTTVKETRTFYGMMAYMMRELLSAVKADDQEKFFKKMFTYEEENTKFVSHAVENQKDYRMPLRLTAEYSLENFVTITPEEVLFRTSGLLSPVTIKDFQIEDKDRCNPISIRFDEDIMRDVNIHFPKSWKLKTTIPLDSIENRFGYLRSHVEQQEGLLHIEQRRHLKKSNAQKELINELADLTGRKKQTIVPTIILSK
jgi:hypothetical protein